eukprot:Polyplicarium_translucidae@DN1811_c0_g1_i1.p2
MASEPPQGAAPSALAFARMAERMGVGRVWNFDVRVLNEVTAGNPLVSVGLRLIGGAMERRLLGCGTGVLMEFLRAIQAMYCAALPYHNAMHGAEVCHSCCWLSRELGLFDRLQASEQLALIVASLCHDVSHPGRSNAFIVNTEHPLAITYNDTSALEQFHAAQTFRCLRDERCNLFRKAESNRDTELFKAFRNCTIELILETDMSKHFEALAKFKIRRQDPDWDMASRSEDRWTATKMCIKAADLGHCGKAWDIHREFSLACLDEFYLQGDEERRLGLTISPLCDRTKPSNVAKSQVGFLQLVCLDVFEELDRVQASSAESASIKRNCVDQINANQEKWLEEGGD